MYEISQATPEKAQAGEIPSDPSENFIQSECESSHIWAVHPLTPSEICMMNAGTARNIAAKWQSETEAWEKLAKLLEGQDDPCLHRIITIH